MADIREGDLFIVGTTTYVVKAAFTWSTAKTSIDPRLALRDTVEFSTKRNPAAVNGKVGAAVASLTGQYCLPLMPADVRIMERAGITGDQLANFGRLMVTYTADGTEVLMFEKRP